MAQSSTDGRPGVATTSDDGGAPQKVPRHWVYPSAAKALERILASGPRVVGFGEYHQRTGSAKVPSAVRRFRDDLLDHLAPKTSDLIVETWMTEGKCGKVEERVVKDVKRTTERPAVTENEIVTLLLRARERNVRPHILKVSCADYQAIHGATQVDYVKLLSFITKQLADKTTTVVRERETQRRKATPTRPGAAGSTAPEAAKMRRTGSEAPNATAARQVKKGGKKARSGAPKPLVVVYGGAIHNDLFPGYGLDAYTYAPAVAGLKAGGFVEVDLYVPEYVAADPSYRKEAWYPLLRRAGPDRVVLIERGQNSYILLFSTTPAPATQRRANRK